MIGRRVAPMLLAVFAVACSSTKSSSALATSSTRLSAGASTSAECMSATSAPMPVQHAPESGHGEIVSIALLPWPEGPSFRLVTTDAHFAAALAELPDPLPKPEAQPSTCCGVGGVVDLGFTDGYHVVYGPCRVPAGIDRARTVIAAVLSTQG